MSSCTGAKFEFDSNTTEIATYSEDGKRFAYGFQCGNTYRLNVPESPWRDLGFDSVYDALRWLEANGYRVM